MIKGGIDPRRCKKCRLNSLESAYNCGYIYNDGTCDKTIVNEFPELGDSEFYTYICLKWYYNEYAELYEVINMYKDSAEVNALPFILRQCIIVHGNYINQLKIYNSK